MQLVEWYALVSFCVPLAAACLVSSAISTQLSNTHGKNDEDYTQDDV